LITFFNSHFISSDILHAIGCACFKSRVKDVRTKMANGANAEDITNTLESYRGKIDPAKYRTLSRGVKVYKMNLLAQEQRNTNRLTAEFKKKLDGYRDCIGTGNCAGSEGNLPDMINSSELPNDYKKALMTRFDDIDELSEMFAEVDNNLMGSVGAVDAYIKKNPDNNKNNARRNKMLKEYINRKTLTPLLKVRYLAGSILPLYDSSVLVMSSAFAPFAILVLTSSIYISLIAFFFSAGFRVFGIFSLRSIIFLISLTAPVFIKPSCCIVVRVSLM
jgi:hypothetical protein